MKTPGDSTACAFREDSEIVDGGFFSDFLYANMGPKRASTKVVLQEILGVASTSSKAGGTERGRWRPEFFLH